MNTGLAAVTELEASSINLMCEYHHAPSYIDNRLSPDNPDKNSNNGNKK